MMDEVFVEIANHEIILTFGKDITLYDMASYVQPDDGRTMIIQTDKGLYALDLKYLGDHVVSGQAYKVEPPQDTDTQRE